MIESIDEKFEDVVSSAGFTRGHLRAVFERVQNHENWKLPIDSSWPVGCCIKEVDEAIAFFTGEHPVIHIIYWTDPEGRKLMEPVRVTARGYYAVCGA